eukprot:GILJ01003431.1.p1 GENE.GILJ01003431.1~~GILJ01003431.1.p1  ORF type:complete len:832 (-),score=95.82 GILJ01003431.1:122-2617(-)
MDLLNFEWADGPVETMESLSKAGKSEEEIEKFAVDENLSEIERARLLLTKGFNVQKIAILVALPVLFRESEAVEQLFPILMNSLPTYDTEVQVVGGNSLAQVAQSQNILSSRHLDQLAPLVSSLLKSRNTDVIHAWTEVFNESVELMGLETVKKHYVPAAVALGDVSRAVSSRLAGVSMIGKLAKVLDRKSFMEKLLQRAVALCQDTDLDVRRVMCSQLPAICKAVVPDPVQDKIVDEILELTRDEEADVKLAAVELLLAVVDVLPGDIVTTKILPVAQKLFDEPPEPLHATLALHFGSFIHKLCTQLPSFDPEPFMLFYKSLSERQDAELRRLCAYNFPGLLQSLSPRHYPSLLHSIHLHLATDSVLIVKKTIAATFHEVARMLGPDKSSKYLKEIFLHLMQDENSEVADSLMANVDVILENFKSTDVAEATQCFHDLLPAFVRYCAVLDKKNWRKALQFLQRIHAFPEYFGSEVMHDSVLPHLVRNMQSAAQPVKLEAGKVLISCLRKNHISIKRKDVSLRLVNDFGRCRSCLQRLLFLSLTPSLAEAFSRQLFRDSFADCVLELSTDSVANVRRQFCVVLPQLRKVFRTNVDTDRLERLSQSLNALLGDADRDVRMAAENASAILNSESFWAPSLLAREEAEDRHKMEEEDNLVKLERKEQEEHKKRQIDEMALQARYDYMASQNPPLGRGRGLPSKVAVGRATSVRSAVKQNTLPKPVEPSKPAPFVRLPSKPTPGLAPLPKVAVSSQLAKLPSATPAVPSPLSTSSSVAARTKPVGAVPAKSPVASSISRTAALPPVPAALATSPVLKATATSSKARMATGTGLRH